MATRASGVLAADVCIIVGFLLCCCAGRQMLLRCGQLLITDRTADRWWRAARPAPLVRSEHRERIVATGADDRLDVFLPSLPCRGRHHTPACSWSSREFSYAVTMKRHRRGRNAHYNLCFSHVLSENRKPLFRD